MERYLNSRRPANICGSLSCPWTNTVLYRFTGRSDGGVPGQGDLTFDNAGNVYGTTELVESRIPIVPGESKGAASYSNL